jgi:hypothetical protein
VYVGRTPIHITHDGEAVVATIRTGGRGE